MFEFALDPHELFAERARQFVGWGIPRSVVNSVRARVREPWHHAPGGWSFEWEQAALRAETRHQWLQASLCHGAAKFPVACNASRQAALVQQVNCYLRASQHFPGHFERRTCTVNYGGQMTQVPVHLFARSKTIPRHTVLLSGGVDTHKMELHRLALALAWLGGLRVAALDMPGTAESTIAGSEHSHLIYEAIIEVLRNEGGQGTKVGMMGISFGGYWAALLALTGKVDCAVNIGGPLITRDRFLDLPFGMSGIVANMLRLEAIPVDESVEQLLQHWYLSDKGLLDRGRASAPLFCANGDRDQYIPLTNTTAFRSLPNARVKVIANATHCAPEKLWSWIPQSILFLRKHLGE